MVAEGSFVPVAGGQTVSQTLDLTISEEAFAYLKIQRGAISDLSTDRQAWEREYRRSLLADMGTMLLWLPERCAAVLDVGSGLGGIDILLSRHYGGRPAIWLLDGHFDDPEVKAHNQTFNSMAVARAFLRDNGAMLKGTASGGDSPRGVAVHDLVISLQAWCFHFPPAGYLSFVKSAMKPGATLILDVRRDRDDWRDELRGAFTEVGIAHSATKFERVVFRNDRLD
jgi:SAM-dependent methyltransferase